MSNSPIYHKKAYHLIGIGGIGMSSIAKLLLHNGCTVTGSDTVLSQSIEQLKAKGAEVFIGHNVKYIKGTPVIIYSSAIKPDNPELDFAKAQGLEIFSRTEFLSLIIKEFNCSIGIAGCHGKTTSTGMIANVFKCANKSFMSYIGGEDNNLGNLYYTGMDYFLGEICEYKRNIDKITCDVGCVLSVGFDHADCYSNADDLFNTYSNYLSRSRIKIVNQDDPYLKNYADTGTVTYGIESSADYVAENIVLSDGKPAFTVKYIGGETRINLNVYGRHNVYNALNAFVAAKSVGVDERQIKEGLEKFSGIKRRFEEVGSINGGRVICDYAHHPDEIISSLKTVAPLVKNKLHVIFQPHTYSRTAALFDEFVRCFKNVEEPIIYKTYPARERYCYEGSAEALFKALDNANEYCDHPEKIKKYLHQKVESGDTVLVLGAGDIYDIVKWAIS